MSITPRFTNAAKHTLKTSRLVARGRGVRHPIGFTPHAQSLVRTVATQATADITPRDLGLAVLRLKEPEVVDKLDDMGLSVDQCTAAFN